MEDVHEKFLNAQPQVASNSLNSPWPQKAPQNRLAPVRRRGRQPAAVEKVEKESFKNAVTVLAKDDLPALLAFENPCTTRNTSEARWRPYKK
ncbi:hypothetical protein [Tabrizicola sp.]|uniref:hypothetical protein n=1 Tax=Tabrizicola sp. TaxID=2005166 RepID=UPI002736F0C2|nr:hypothetical protein [Tabrizicola sp.]MDP3649646.1 hypothetical protein [Paracoccaceae bacterium]